MRDGLGAFVPGTEVDIAGADGGPLSGLTFAAKDIYDIAGHVTGCGNPDWARTHPPAESTAPSVQAWLDAGARLVAKTITDELAFSLNGQNHHYGTPTNVNAPGRIPGGSSSGSAAAVAGGLVDLAFGSDTGGSVRIPASFCGLYGIRTSHGRVPLDGIMPLAPSLDTVGWFARDAGLLRRAGEPLLTGQDTAEPATRLIVAEDSFEIAEPDSRAALAPHVERLKARFGVVEEVRVGDPQGFDHWIAQFRTLLSYEALQSHKSWILETSPHFGPDVGSRFEQARLIADETAEAASAERAIFAERMAALMKGAVLCKPTAAHAAPPDVPPTAEAWDAHRTRTHKLTCVAGLAYLPEVTLPLARVDGCPLGFSLVGAPGSDRALLELAEAFTAETADGLTGR